MFNFIYPAYELPDYGKNFLSVCIVILIALATIFLGLLIIKFFIKLIKGEPLGNRPVKSTSNTESGELISENNVTNNDEIVAVIAAAIATAESENSGLKFRVVSFKRV